jgi:hypothetical protein
MEYKYYLMILVLLARTIHSESIPCITSLTCQQTLCCKKGQCVDNNECVWDTYTAYISCGAVGGVFLIGTIIYFLKTIKECRSQVREMMENLQKAN